MFARTTRLLLRPGFPEDKAVLAAAIGDEAMNRGGFLPPWPCHIGKVEALLGTPPGAVLPTFLMLERTEAAPRLVGACGLHRRRSGAVELWLWVARAHRGRGLASEAGLQLIEIARTLRLASLEATPVLDDSASVRLLEKLGFAATGLAVPRADGVRGAGIEAAFYQRSLVSRENRMAA
jgi:RimJ/RimL family protein N-acetyltransferase